ncbi:transcriptional regulator [Paenibacillus beijingensis]|uniref:Transcriptional regulator n=1 Tax=Paenibacillus beijingensis TaxID=1126833 RepID=A0A0D5NS32_9BACL|nr:transcriptional regulator [Paenibacillus beijingensis]
MIVINQLSSSDKLLSAAIELMAEKGYHGVTTREIAAAAGLNEVTLFRQFGSKQKLLEAAFERYHYTEEMIKLFNEKLEWELHTDLLLISRTYHDIMNRNRKMIQIGIKEGNNLPGFHERARRGPQQLKTLLTAYFTAMVEKGRLIRTNPELQALSFMWMNYGAFVSSLGADETFPGVPMEDFIEESVRLFARALTP